MKKRAFLIASSKFNDTRLTNLNAPPNDIKSFSNILESKKLCNFDSVEFIINNGVLSVKNQLEAFLQGSNSDDFILIYYTGHGLTKGEKLFFAVTETNVGYPHTASLEASYLMEQLDGCSIENQLVILDCCYSGAFIEGAKGSEPVNFSEGLFETPKKGRYILTSSLSNQITQEKDGKSIYTSELIKGIESGAAAKGKKRITITDLDNYLSGKFTKGASPIQPQSQSEEGIGQFVLAQNVNYYDPISPKLLAKLENKDEFIRVGAINELVRQAKITRSEERRQEVVGALKERLNKVSEPYEKNINVIDAINAALEAIKNIDNPRFFTGFTDSIRHFFRRGVVFHAKLFGCILIAIVIGASLPTLYGILILYLDRTPPVFTSALPTSTKVPTDLRSNIAKVSWDTITASDANGVKNIDVEPKNGSIFSMGETPVMIKATDRAGNETTHSFSVTVVDEENPVIYGMPDDISKFADIGKNSKIISWKEPVAKDNDQQQVNISSNYGSGSKFEVGEYKVTYTAEDMSGNKTQNFFTITVKPNKKIDGELMILVQKQLTRLGIYNGELDGKYGNQTEEGIREFQRENNISVDGIATESLLVLLQDAEPQRIFGCISVTATVDKRKRIGGVWVKWDKLVSEENQKKPDIRISVDGKSFSDYCPDSFRCTQQFRHFDQRLTIKIEDHDFSNNHDLIDSGFCQAKVGTCKFRNSKIEISECP